MKAALENVSGITLGMNIRALRMGFAWSHEHGAFVKIQGAGPFKITLHPAGLIPKGFANTGENHWAWWSEEGGRLDLNRIKPLRVIKRVKRVVQFWVNDEGEML